jgi:hypothetical protein
MAGMAKLGPNVTMSFFAVKPRFSECATEFERVTPLRFDLYLAGDFFSNSVALSAYIDKFLALLNLKDF